MWFPLAFGYSICITVYVFNLIYQLYGVPCDLQGVPVTKSDILSSDPKLLKMYISL